MDDGNINQEILDAITYYIQKVRQAGIEVVTAVLFGSFSQGTATVDSNIDLIVVAPEFDRQNESQLNLLWELGEMLFSCRHSHQLNPLFRYDPT